MNNYLLIIGTLACVNVFSFANEMIFSKKIFDSHCHLHLQRLPLKLYPDEKIALMSVDQFCWDQIIDIQQNCASGGSVTSAFGIHPWFAHHYPDSNQNSEWFQILKRTLIENPRAIVGEIGLDKMWIPKETGVHDWKSQIELFTMQLKLATELHRPISIHCVHSQGDMLNILKEMPELPPSICLHSYGGSADMVKSYCNMKKYGDRFYFGFSFKVNSRSPKTPRIIAACPANRIMLESDFDEQDGRHDKLIQMAANIACARNWTIEEAIEKTHENSMKFYQINDN